MQFQAELFIFFLGQFQLATHGAAKPVLPMQGFQVFTIQIQIDITLFE